MAKYMQMSVNSPSIEFEIGGKVIESEVIANLQKGPNFTNPVLVVVVVRPKSLSCIDEISPHAYDQNYVPSGGVAKAKGGTCPESNPPSSKST